jgi:hypothetical protein
LYVTSGALIDWLPPQKRHLQMKTQGPTADGLRESVASSISRGKDAVSAAASDAMDTAGSDLKALQSDLSDLKETVTKLVSRAGDEATKSAREIAGQVTRSTRTPRHTVECRCSDRPCPRGLALLMVIIPHDNAQPTWVLVGQVSSLFS